MGIDKESGYSKSGRALVSKARVAEYGDGQADAAIDAQLALEEAERVLQTQKGYFRIGAGADGLVWARWKWTQGPLAGRYVFSRNNSLSAALEEVCRNAGDVISGKRAAALDRAP